MPSPFYNQSSGPRSSGAGVSSDGYDGAQGFFKNVKALAGELHLLPAFDPNVSAKAAADAFLACKNGVVSPQDAFFHEGKVPNDFPQLNLDHAAQPPMVRTDAGQLQNGTKSFSKLGDSLSQTGHGIDQLMSNMSQMMQSVFSGPAGIIGSMIGFLSELFTSIAKAVGEAITEFARAAESVAEETWKKEIEQMSSIAHGSGGTQSLELWNQAATSQTLAHSLKNTTT